MGLGYRPYNVDVVTALTQQELEAVHCWEAVEELLDANALPAQTTAALRDRYLAAGSVHDHG